MKRLILGLLAATLLTSTALGANQEKLWEAARNGDLAAIKEIHAAGVDLNSKTKYGATALSFASDKGHLEAVLYLLENGAEVNAPDTFYQATPLQWALSNNHLDVVKALLKAGSKGAADALMMAIRKKDKELAQLSLDSEEIDADVVARAINEATTAGADEIITLLKAVDIENPKEIEIEIEPQQLASYAGKYHNDEIAMTIEVRIREGKLFAQAEGQRELAMKALSAESFQAVDIPQIKVTFAGRGGLTERMVLEQGTATFVFMPVTATAAAEAAEKEVAVESDEAAEMVPAITRKAPQNWPSFRGPHASGIADGQGAPVEWDVKTGANIRWKTPIPGIADSSPVIWGDRVFVNSAVSEAGNDTFRTGLYGDVGAVDDLSQHAFKLYCVDKTTGAILWEKTVKEDRPKVKRHTKSSQANSTPATDGKHVVVLFGSIGLLACYDFDGNLLWQVDLGVLDSGWFYDSSYQWGHASSPVIYKNTVIVQADIQKDSFIAAYRLTDGKQMWKTAREEIPTWGSPTIVNGPQRDDIVTNGTKIRGYDAATGKEVWSLGPNSEVTVATPVFADNLIYLTAGYPPVRPVYAVKAGASGDISLAEGEETNGSIQWSKNRGGTYIPTPIVYGGYLYTCANDGRLTCYDAKTGERIYRARIGGGTSFSASPIAADGRLYFTSELGDIFVVKSGSKYQELVKNPMGEVCMGTPAISDGILVVRTLKHLFGIGDGE